MACIAPIPELRIDSDIRFCSVNFAVLVLMMLYSQCLGSNLAHKAGLLTLTTLWQARNGVFWFSSKFTVDWWIWDTVFHLVLTGLVGLRIYYL